MTKLDDTTIQDLMNAVFRCCGYLDLLNTQTSCLTLIADLKRVHFHTHNPASPLLCHTLDQLESIIYTV